MPGHGPAFYGGERPILGDGGAPHEHLRGGQRLPCVTRHRRPHPSPRRWPGRGDGAGELSIRQQQRSLAGPMVRAPRTERHLLPHRRAGGAGCVLGDRGHRTVVMVAGCTVCCAGTCRTRAEADTMTSFSVSASQLKLYQLCPRSWYLKHVLRVPDDQGAGGLYLTLGNDFDRLVQLHVRDGVTGDSGAPKLANRQLTEAGRHLPLPRTAEVQFSYDIDAGGFHVRGKPDIRRPAWVKDTKTTSDRGPGRGKDKDSPPYALTDAHTPGGNVRPLADDVQARLYAWCEFQLDPALASVYAEWVYVSKADCPVCWTSAVDFDRADTLAWFDTVVRPIVARMMAYTKLHAEHPGNLHAEDIGANPDSCRRCFVRAACPGAFDGVNVYGITPPKEPRKPNMAFDLSTLRTPATATATAPPVVDPVAQLEASIAAVCDQVAAVAINRPAS